MNPAMSDLMRQAMQLTSAGQLQEATRAIQQALAQGGRPADSAAVHAAAPSGLVLDGCVFETRREPVVDDGVGVAPDETFTAGVHSHAGLTRDYKLYTPPGGARPGMPLVVMLHGCTQDPDDFAAGTAMNAHAQRQGFLVLYPAQSHSANPSRCWNWFKHNHQRRGAGEPALIADLVHKVVRDHGVDPQRIFIAGLSAGGAMAAVVAAAYPELFAAVGVHSGLPVASANGVPEAMAVMRSGSGRGPAAAAGGPRVRTIVFHGDRDGTVHPRNGQQVLADVLSSAGPAGTPAGTDAAMHAVESKGASPRGQAYTRATYADAGGITWAEHWTLHGAGHAWSGGQASGSYTDPSGVDASAEMLRFFMA